MKPGPNYKMSKQSKRFLATIIDPHLRGQIKKGTIQSELSSLQSIRQPRGERK